MHRINMLVVEDNDVDAEEISRLLSRFGFAVARASTLAEALEACTSTRVDIAMLDLNLPDATGGVETVREFQAMCPTTAVVVLTGDSSRDQRDVSMELGIEDYLVKGGFTAATMLAVLEKAVAACTEAQIIEPMRQWLMEVGRHVRSIKEQMGVSDPTAG